MATEMLFNESRTAIARESTYGTDQIAADIAADAAIRYEAFTEVTATTQGEFLERNIRSAAFSNHSGVYLRNNMAFTIGGLLPAPATAGDAPLGLDHLLIASGFGEALVDNTTATYTLSTPATAGVTIYHWHRHVDAADTWRMTYGTGVRGNMTFQGSVGEFATFTFTGQSNNYPDSSDTADFDGWSADLAFFNGTNNLVLDKTGADISVAYTGTETYDDPTALYLEAATITVDSVAFPCSAFSIDVGNNVIAKRITSATPVVDQVLITGRSVQGEFTLEDTGAAFEKAIDLIHASSSVSATIVLTDRQGSGGTTVTFTMPKLQLRSLGGPSDSNGLAAWTLPFQANGDHATDGIADDELSIVWSVTS